MTVNLELLNDTLKVIKLNPELHGQSTWVSKAEHTTCGTTMCFAGHAAVLAGAEIPDPKKHTIDDWFVAKDENNSYLNMSQVYYANDAVPNQHVQDFATKALGISSEERDYLFEADRTMDEIELAVQELNETGEIQTMWEEDEDYYDDCGCGECR